MFTHSAVVATHSPFLTDCLRLQEEKHARLSKIVAIRQKEWAAQDAGWRALAEKLVEEEEAIKMKEKILISKIIEMLSGKMFSVCFRGKVYKQPAACDL